MVCGNRIYDLRNFAAVRSDAPRSVGQWRRSYRLGAVPHWRGIERRFAAVLLHALRPRGHSAVDVLKRCRILPWNGKLRRRVHAANQFGLYDQYGRRHGCGHGWESRGKRPNCNEFAFGANQKHLPVHPGRGQSGYGLGADMYVDCAIASRSVWRTQVMSIDGHLFRFTPIISIVLCCSFLQIMRLSALFILNWDRHISAALSHEFDSDTFARARSSRSPTCPRETVFTSLCAVLTLYPVRNYQRFPS